MFDILFRNAKVIDGTGNPWFYGDVGVEGGTVAAVLPPAPRPAPAAWRMWTARRSAPASWTGTAIRNCRSSPGRAWTARSCRA